MRTLLLCCALLFASCGKQEAQNGQTSSSQEVSEIETLIDSLYAGLDRAYNGAAVDTDSLIDFYFEKDVRYVTPWGWTEPLDTTKARLRSAARHVSRFSHRIESMEVKTYGDAAYAFFILRQNYLVDGSPLEEYLPTTLVLEWHGSAWKIVHVHRSTDYETIQQYVALQRKRAAKK